MYCKHCGREIDDRAVFCPHCGVETDNAQNYGEQYETKPKANRALVTAAKVFIILSFVSLGLALPFYLMCTLTNGVGAYIQNSYDGTIDVYYTAYLSNFILYLVTLIAVVIVGTVGVTFGVKALKCMKAGVKPSVTTGVCVLIFLNLIAGILLLCSKDGDYELNAITEDRQSNVQPKPNRALVKAAKVFMIIGLVVLGLVAVVMLLMAISSIDNAIVYKGWYDDILSGDVTAGNINMDDKEFTYVQYCTGITGAIPFICMMLYTLIYFVAGIISTVKVFKCKKAGVKPSASVNICTLIFVSRIAGILLLCSKDKDYINKEQNYVL